MNRVLVVEDDPKLGDGLREFLGQHQFVAEVAPTGRDALEAVGVRSFDAILLDLMLPDMDGLEVMRRVRTVTATPLLLVTARGDDADKILGLELGADDYIAKPFNPRELVARLRAVLRRSAQAAAAPGEVRVGELTLDPSAREVRVRGARVELTTLEFEVLAALARSPGRVLSREQLLDMVKGAAADEVFDRSIDVHVSRLRQKLEDDPRQPRFIKTVRGIGYALNRAE